MNLEAIDIIYIIIIFVLGLSGFKKGFFSQLFTIIGIVLGLFLGYFFSDDLGEVIIKYINIDNWSPLVSFVIIFLGIVIICNFLNKAFKDTLEALGAQGMDKIFGFLFGASQGVIICVGITALLTFQSFIDPSEIFEGSSIGAVFCDFLPKLENLLPQTKDFLETIEKEL